MTHNTASKTLVLDDDPFILKLLARMLENQGIEQVACFECGHCALQWMDTQEADMDLILLDLNMPGMDGVQFIRKLTERNYRGHLILVSGEDERILQTAEQLVKAYRLLGLGHLNKPITSEKLADVLTHRSNYYAQTEPRIEKSPYSSGEIGAAIANRELVNFYQPKVSLANGKPIGVEALVRWRHPRDGLVFPDQFITVAEENGLIDDLTRLVYENAITQTKDWQNAGIHLRVAINVSMDNLHSLDFADFVASTAAAAGVAPADVVLEVTESRLMHDLITPLDILTRLRLKRFSLSIDDFGTGNSTLAQLRDIPFDELKVDRGFVHGANRNDTLRAIFEASHTIAKQLGMRIVAEGVEDIEDWNYLRSVGCDQAQGYLIGKPMPGPDLPAWIGEWEERLPELSRAFGYRS